MHLKVLAINIKPRKENERGIPKESTDYATVTKQGLENDFNRYRWERKENTPDQAILFLHQSTIRFLKEKGWPVEIGHLGENIPLDGEPSQLKEGTQIRIGNVTLQITKRCYPCNNLKALPYVDDNNIEEFKRLLYDKRGWYARVLEEGVIQVGSPIELISSE